MIYSNIRRGTFLLRPNRFIAHVEIDGKVEICHVKNTGRCRELLIPGASVLVQECPSPSRKTKFDLICVYKGKRLINMDSQAPNRVVGEWLCAGALFPDITLCKSEYTWGNSRFDYYVETPSKRVLLEVKGVTLEESGVALFPDAPTQRGVRHLLELTRAVEQGYEAWALFVVQMEHVRYFTPNRATHPQFADALVRSQRQGVHLLALECMVTPSQLSIRKQIPIEL